MPTTTARTPRPSANAAPMMKVARIWAAASGLRPIALRRHAGQDPDADAGADDAEGREAGSDVSMCVDPPARPVDAG